MAIGVPDYNDTNLYPYGKQGINNNPALADTGRTYDQANFGTSAVATNAVDTMNAGQVQPFNASSAFPASLLNNSASNIDFNNILKQNQGLREKYLGSLAPSTGTQDLQTQLTDLQGQISGKMTSAKQGLLNIENKPVAMEFIAGEQAALQKQANLDLETLQRSETNLLTRLGLSQEADKARQTALATGLDFATQDQNLAFKVQEMIDNRQAQTLSLFDKYTTQQKKDAADILESLKGIDPTNLSPQAQMQIATIAAQRGISPSDIISGLQVEFDKTEADKIKESLSTQLTKSQIYKNMTDASGGGTDNAGLLAYAQQYASTGTIPTGLPKGTFGQVSELAKQLPKQVGTLYNVNTGVAPSGLSATESGNISTLYDLTNKLIQFKDTFSNISTGFVPGLLKFAASPVYKTQDTRQYQNLKSEIVDLIARARTGAAITASEEELYSKKLPNTFNLEKSGLTDIDSLLQSISGKLNAVATNNNVRIYGVDITSDGVVKDGDVVEKGGKKYRFTNNQYEEIQ